MLINLKRVSFFGSTNFHSFNLQQFTASQHLFRCVFERSVKVPWHSLGWLSNTILCHCLLFGRAISSLILIANLIPLKVSVDNKTIRPLRKDWDICVFRSRSRHYYYYIILLLYKLLKVLLKKEDPSPGSGDWISSRSHWLVRIIEYHLMKSRKTWKENMLVQNFGCLRCVSSNSNFCFSNSGLLRGGGGDIILPSLYYLGLE